MQIYAEAESRANAFDLPGRKQYVWRISGKCTQFKALDDNADYCFAYHDYSSGNGRPGFAAMSFP